MNERSLLLGLCLLLLSSAAVAAQPGCMAKVKAGWIRAAPPGADVLAGYARVSNPCATSLSLVGIESKWFAMAMLHETETKGGTSAMRASGVLVVPAHGALEFSPGRRHFMLMHPRRRLVTGDQVPLVLVFSNGSRVAADFTVRPDAPLAAPKKN